MNILGVDVGSKSSVVFLLQSSDELQQLRRIASKAKGVDIPYSADGFKALSELKFDMAVLEPTGGHYSKLIAKWCEDLGARVCWVEHRTIANYRKSHGISNKSDSIDALSLAAYGMERMDSDRAFLLDAPKEMRSAYLRLLAMQRSRRPHLNRLRQLLTAECPEIAQSTIERSRWLSTGTPKVLDAIVGTATTGKFARLIESSIGLGISEESRALASLLIHHFLAEIDAERAIEDLITSDAKLSAYAAVLEGYKMGRSTQAALLSQVYPIERFLVNGHKVRSPFNHSDQSLASFKLACGVGRVLHQSGATHIEQYGGSKYCRSALFMWAKTAIVMGKHKEHSDGFGVLLSYYRSQDCAHKLAVMRAVSKALRMIYRDLLKL